MQKPLLTKKRQRQIDDTLQEALRLHRGGQLDTAEELYRSVLALKPNHVDALHMLGLIRFNRGDAGEALQCFTTALRGSPRSAEVLSNHGMVLNALQRHEEALASFDRALAERPDFAEVHANRGNALLRLGRSAEALCCYERAVALKPDHFASQYNRSNALLALDRPADALAAYDVALTLQPNSVEALNNRGNALLRLGRTTEALASYERAGALAPANAHTMSNLGNALVALGRPADALAHFEAALRLTSDFADARYNAAMARLALGDFRQGWADYEARWRTPQFQPQRRSFTQPLWLGQEPLAGKTILLHAEQGFGDTLQFVRYVPLIAAQGANVVLEVQASLAPLLASLAGVEQIVSRGEPLPPFDLHCPLMSLPHARGTDLATIPDGAPYITPPPERAERWRERLAHLPGQRVGLAWAGRPTHLNDRHRSIALDQLRPLIEATPASFVSLQRDLRDGDATLLERLSVTHLGGELADFADTAAVVATLDLVISVDTAIVHLAGALGKPVWILLPHPADFRWLTARDDSPWYPTARLFRQSSMGDWAPVIANVAESLARLR